MNDKARGTIEMTLAMVISGTVGWLVVLSGQAPMTIVFWRCVFGAVVLLGVCAALGLLRDCRISWRAGLAMAAGGAALACNWLLLFGAYPRASISIATVVFNTQPFILLLFGAVFFGERLTPSKVLWLMLAFVGMLLIVQAKPHTDTGGADYITGVLMALAAAFAYAVSAVITKHLRGIPSHLVALFQITAGTIVLIPFVDTRAWQHEPATWGVLVIIGVVHTGLVSILLFSAIQRLPTNLLGSLSFIYPIAAIVVDYLAFGHRLYASQFAGSAIILLAVAGTNFGWSLWPQKSISR